MEDLTIGKVAGQAGVGVETVRFYEREGLLEQPPRRPSGYRQYPQEAVLRLRFIRRAKQLGFSLREIKELLLLRVGGGTSCSEVRRRAEAKIAVIEEKIEALNRIRKGLTDLVDACSARQPTDPCPILAALEEPEDQA